MNSLETITVRSDQLKQLHVFTKCVFVFLLITQLSVAQTQPVYLQVNKDKTITYIPDEQGNILPDFSRVGYANGDKPIPFIEVIRTVKSGSGNDQQQIQKAIDEVSGLPLQPNGFRGCIVLEKGVYKIPGTIKISASGIVLRGEGEETKLIATGKGQRSLISVSGKGNIAEIKNTRQKIKDKYVPVGVKQFSVASSENFKAGDHIIVFRPGTANWIHDLKMDSINQRDTTIKQWQPHEYDLLFERVITKVDHNKIFIDNSIVMAMEEKYGGGEIFKYSFDGRLENIGVENLYCESEYANDTDEDHGWNAILFNRVQNSWIRNVTSRYFGYSCVNLGADAKNITVDSCRCLQPKSQIIGGRRYSFNNDGQLNLVMHCFASEGRHDYVTGAKVRGPNVFYNCTVEKANADIGPHHRWAMGTLYDNIKTDGEINIQDRGDWGTGHGWSGVNQILWNCIAAKSATQDPWVSGRNIVVNLTAKRYEGRLTGRPQSKWEISTTTSLYEAQLNAKQQ